ncbi:hypothetical protein [Methanobrevibacter millerae]|jgi:cytoskeletal protein RodZ|uniref:Uncharacterized protein n=1 Tax=Methanobrevibacter millerae TaxID=230361 RepID=A0A0U3E9E5_9EURY|nr:hypothetical protein [Methanobrevibacter millerae]ALT69552.1 hypothetical protein sm9_1785 [Methanobrevibacter millerae]
MKSKNIILILTIIVIILAAAIAVEAIILNNKNTVNPINNTTTSNTTTVVSISNDSQQSSDSSSSENSIDSNRPKNDPNYKGYNPYHESEVTSDGWNPKEHEVGRDKLNDGSQRIRYDDGYFRIVDKNGYVITYGYGG